PLDRAVLHRAPLRQGRRAHPAAHPAAEPALAPGPAAPHPDRSHGMTALTDTAPGGLIEIRDVHKSFGDLEVLRGIDLTLAPGSVTAILGPSGSGKSTLLRTINHLETVDRGLISVDGEVIGYRSEADLPPALPALAL